MGKRRAGGEVWVECFSPVPCWHFSMMTRKSLPSWPQCWASHSGNSDNVPAKPPDKVLKVMEGKGAQDGRHSRAASPGREFWAASYCFADFRKRKDALPSTRTTLKPCGRRRDLLDREWSYCASGTTSCPRGRRRSVGSLQVQGSGGQRRRGEIYEAESDGRCQAAASRLLTRKGKGSGVELPQRERARCSQGQTLVC